MESQLLNAVNCIKNISKKKVKLTRTKVFRKKKSYSLAKRILIILLIVLMRTVRFKSGEMEKMQLSKLPTKSAVPKYLHHLKVLMTAQKRLEKTTYSRIKRKIVLQWKHSSVTRVQ